MSNGTSTTILKKLFNRTGTAALAMAAIILPACGTPVAEVDSQEDAQENVTAGELDEDNLAAYVGESVTVRQEVDEVVADYAFLLDEDEVFGGEQTLVINASGQAVDLVEGEDTDVQVTGEVQELILADLEQQYGFDLDDNLLVEYEQQPVIIAQSIALSPDPDDITDNPEQYYNRRIALNGEVENVLDTNIVTIDEESLFGGQDILVINPNAEIVPQQGEEVTATGTLRPFVAAEIEEEYNLTWDLDVQQQIEAEYSERPVFIADEIYPSAM